MWIRKELKLNARKAIRKNYWGAVAICFIMAIIVGKYSYSTSAIYQYNEDNEIQQSVVEPEYSHNTEIVNDFLASVSGDETNIILGTDPKATKGVLSKVFNNSHQSNSVLFGILNSINQTFFSDKVGAGIIVFIGALLSALVFIFVSNLLKVCECRFFLENRLYKDTKINRLLFLYKMRIIWNPAKIMLCRSL
ncbi:MAG: hypothetical protein Q4C00_06065 [Bacillota bacterium]|nr:hypothetical protein [Bacillota bacterium]